MIGQRLVFNVVGVVVNAAFLVLCTKAFCSHFYNDLKRLLRHRRQQIEFGYTPSLVSAVKARAKPVIRIRADGSLQRPR